MWLAEMCRHVPTKKHLEHENVREKKSQNRNSQFIQWTETLGGSFKDFLLSPRSLGKVFHVTNMFQMGWNPSTR